MRKVYQPSSGSAGWAVSVLIAVGAAGTIFCTIPFLHNAATPSRVLELRKTSATDLPPPKEEETPPPPEAEAKKDEVAPPTLGEEAAPVVPLMADLDVAEGAGGYLPGFVTSLGTAAAGAEAALDTFDVSDLERRPEVVAQVAPVYPPELRKAKVEGTVTVVFLLTEEGRVEDARVQDSSRSEFERPALDAVRRWRFKPGMKDGAAVKTHMRLPIRFRLGTS